MVGRRAMDRAARACFSALSRYARVSQMLRKCYAEIWTTDRETQTGKLGCNELHLPQRLSHSSGRPMSAANLGKRKRTVVPGATIVKGKESAPVIQFSNAGQFRDALRDENAEGVKGGTSWASNDRLERE